MKFNDLSSWYIWIIYFIMNTGIRLILPLMGKKSGRKYTNELPLHWVHSSNVPNSSAIAQNLPAI